MEYLEYLPTLAMMPWMQPTVVLSHSPGILPPLMREMVSQLLSEGYMSSDVCYYTTGAITGYQLDVFFAGNNQRVLTVSPTTTSHQVTGLVCCSDYTWRVAASTSVGFGPFAMGRNLRTLANLTSESWPPIEYMHSHNYHVFFVVQLLSPWLWFQLVWPACKWHGLHQLKLQPNMFQMMLTQLMLYQTVEMDRTTLSRHLIPRQCPMIPMLL